MPQDLPDFQELARFLPDIPRWVEVRGMLLAGICEVLGLETEPELAFVAAAGNPSRAYVVGPAGAAAIHQAAAPPKAFILAPPEQIAHVEAILAGWQQSPVTIFSQSIGSPQTHEPENQVRFLGPNERELLRDLPEELREELLRAITTNTLCALFANGRAVSFCYACAVTETLWDVSIDTLEAHRNRGYGTRTAAFLIQHMRDRHKEPVWGAEDSNLPSIRMARTLGFEPVDRMMLFRRPPSSELLR